MELTKEQIEKIEILLPNYEQGIYTEPYGILHTIKEPVIYMRWKTGGVSGGSCWDSSNPKSYVNDKEKPNFEVLDLVLSELMPTITYLQFKEIEKLIHTNDETEYEYYGNCTDYEIKYVILSELIRKLEEFQNKNI